MNAPPFRALRFPPGYLALPAPAETVLALLRQCEDGGQEWDRMATIAALDPALSFELLLAVPPASAAAGFDLQGILAEGMSFLGQDLLRAYCLNKLLARRSPAAIAATLRDALHSLFVAELALHLAVELRQGSFHEAYAAGLLHDVGALWLTCYAEGHGALRAASSDEGSLSVAELGRYAVSHGAAGAALAARCGLPAAIADAIHLHHCSREAIADAAPVARMVWLAEEIAGSRFEVSEHDLGPAAAVSGLDAATLAALRADVARRLASLTRQHGIPAAGSHASAGGNGVPAAEEATAPAAARDDAVGAAAISALGRAAVQDADEAGLPPRLGAACRLLIDLDAPLLMEFDATSAQLCGVADAQRPWAAELRVATAGSGSAIARVHRDAAGCQALDGAGGPQHSAADWQLARRLGAEGLLCEPWHCGGARGVAVFGLEAPYADDRIRATVRRSLVMAAADRLARQRRVQDMRREAQAEQRARYADHYRRLAHEASNPLSVMKTYLGVMRQRAGTLLDAEVALMDKEVDRVTAMVRAMARPPDDAMAPDEGDGGRAVEVCGLIEDLRILYAEALFAGRGIDFALSSTPGPLWAAMPRDALKQVLLNLFKNASEALGAGRRFSVALLPEANLGGLHCLVIRMSDDGDGIAPQAMTVLFAQPRSSKDGEHRGLGLVLVREILARYGASIVCESDSHTGTTFNVYIPIADKP